MTSPAREKKLSERLLAVASMVAEAAGGLGLSAGAARVVDIGTDHAYLPIFLVRQGIAGHVIAADVNDGPLERARQHVEEAGLTGQITLRLSDGFAAIAAGEADIAVLSGMGGRLMPIQQRLLGPVLFQRLGTWMCRKRGRNRWKN